MVCRLLVRFVEILLVLCNVVVGLEFGIGVEEVGGVMCGWVGEGVLFVFVVVLLGFGVVGIFFGCMSFFLMCNVLL